MFTRPLLNAHPARATQNLDATAPQHRLGDYGYGKENVRVFQVHKNGDFHTVIEFKVTIKARLNAHKEMYNADNSDVVGSDVMETHVFLHAQQHGLTTVEEFALTLSQTLLDKYAQIVEVNIIVEDLSWNRLGDFEKQGIYKNAAHNHVFTRNENERRFCELVRKRDAVKQPLLIGGFYGLRIVKTAQAPFVGYNKSGAMHTEGDRPDRVLCVDINARWQYAYIDNIDFQKHWHQVRDLILHSFAGDPTKGTSTTSVQFASYAAEKAVLNAMPEICSITAHLQNYAHIKYDFSRLPAFDKKSDVTIIVPVETPNSIGYSHLDRLESIEASKL